MNFTVVNSNNVKNGMRHTIVDVAKHAGVAVSTVSRVINNKCDVSQETRMKVQQAMRDLDFVPNIAAKALGSGTGTNMGNNPSGIGLLVHEDLIHHPYFIHILKGAEKQLSSYGYKCIFAQVKMAGEDGTTGDGDVRLPHIFFDGSVNGIIAVGVEDGYLVDFIQKQKLPAVLVDSADFGSEFNYIQADNVEGARKAVSYLIGLGHKNIMFIRGGMHSGFFNDLEYGYMQAFRMNGLEYRQQLVISGGNSFEAGYELAKSFLQAAEIPTAVFTNDITALGVVKAVREYGMKIPEDISVVGFDDIDAVSYIDPALTTIGVPKEEIGRFAVEKLIQMVKGEGNQINEKILLPTRLIIRNSASQPAERQYNAPND